MTAELRATPARVALLQAVAHGEVTCTFPWNAQWRPPGRTAQDVSRRIGGMEAGGFVRIGPGDSPLASATHLVELTAAGRAVLDNAKES